jgi:phosphonopyruvate decarboxylase
MKMGTLATVGHYWPKKLLHIVLDNEAHESTGGQATACSTTDLAAVASGCGYARAWRVESREELAQRVREAKSTEGPNLIHAKVALGYDPNLGRPDLSPVEVKKQFIHWLLS